MSKISPTMVELKFSIKLALGFFVIGTIILLSFAIKLSSTVAMLGYIYTAFAFLIGSIYVIIITIKIVSKKLDFRTGVKVILVMMLNVPISLFYIFIVLTLMSYARITFENTTEYNLTSIKISGCQNKEIKELRTGESKTVWIGIPTDCQVDIQYEVNGDLKRETVVGYLTNSGGIVATYKIGSNQDVQI